LKTGRATPADGIAPNAASFGLRPAPTGPVNKMRFLLFIASEYVSQLKTAGHPTVISGNQIVSGRVVLTVEPTIEEGTTFQIQVPGGFDVKENLCMPLLFSLVFNSADVWWPLWLRISASLSKTGSFSDVVNGCTVTGSLLGRDVVLNLSPNKSPK
jgi:hypothetical protein